MSDDTIRVEGVVVEQPRGGIFFVDVALGERTHRVVARRAGRLVLHRIALMPGDRCEVEISPYDVTRGRIIFRGPHRDPAGPP